MIVCPACGRGPGESGSCECRRMYTRNDFWTFSGIPPAEDDLRPWRFPCLTAHADGRRALWLEEYVVRPLRGAALEGAVQDMIGTVLMCEVLGT